MKFDLSKYELKDTATCNIMVRGEPMLGENDLPVSVELYGVGTPEHTVAQQKLKKSITWGGNKALQSDEQAIKDWANYLAGITKTINNFPCDSFFDVYNNVKLSYITDQVTSFLNEKESFLPS